jgi:hypothetical protein
MPLALIAVALAFLCACGGAPTSGVAAVPERSRPFAGDALWDDGRAEVDAYQATVRRYGTLRPLTAYLIVVKEDFSRRQLVKADPDHDPGDLLPVLKLNHVINYQTGIYSYHQMASCFFDRSSMELVKFSLTSNEWCGNSYKEYTRRSERGSLHVHTYWDNQAEATYDLPVDDDVVFYDQLPLWIRSLPQTPGTALSLRIVPTQIESRGAKPSLVSATLRAVSAETVQTPAGPSPALRWELKGEEETPDVYWTSRESPYVLVAWDRPDGGAYRLKWTQRLAYWKLNHPGDESYLEGPEAGATPARKP